MLNEKYPFKLPQYEYSFQAFEPYIDSETMYIHYEKLFKGYIDNLNKALANYPTFHKMTLYELLTTPFFLRNPQFVDIIRYAGGVYNHYMYFNKIAPPFEKQVPNENLMINIESTFGSFNKFQDIFSNEAKKVFGSGWTYLVTDQNGRLNVMSTKNQDTPLIMGLKPIILIDIWEHAYFLKYKNLRVDYINNMWNLYVWK